MTSAPIGQAIRAGSFNAEYMKALARSLCGPVRLGQELTATYSGQSVVLANEPEVPPPIICPEVHNTRPVDPDECMKAVRDFARSHK
jgi:hypothetical protein